MNKSKFLQIAESPGLSGKGYSDWDTLGFRQAHEAFLKIIETIVPPLTVGLYGDWGSGKTRMIEGLEASLTTKGYLTLVFDAWKHRKEQNLVLPLMCALQRTHLKDKEYKDNAKKIILSTALALGIQAFKYSANQALKNTIGIDVAEAVKDAKDGMNAYENDYEFYKKYEDSVSKIEKEYEEFIGDLLEKNGKKKLIIFIDNLDRCLPDIVVNLLEDISSFLSIRGVPCVYVLAMDKEHVIKAVRHRFPDFDGSHYLEKIVQIPLKMPKPSKEDGLSHLLKRFEWAKPSETDEPQSNVRYNKVFDRLKSVDQIFQNGLLGNPRRMERIINKLIMLEAAEIFDIEKNSENIPAVMFLILIAEYFPDVFNSLKTDLDMDVLYDFLQRSNQLATSPYKERILRGAKEKEPNYIVKNEVVLNAYCDNEIFYDFLKQFVDVVNKAGFAKQLKDMKKYLDYIG